MKSLDELLQMDECERIEYLYGKAKELKKRLNPEYEEMIKVNSKCAYLYILNIIKERWSEAEPYIIKKSIIYI